jgi:hypothetical protein
MRWRVVQPAGSPRYLNESRQNGRGRLRDAFAALDGRQQAGLLLVLHSSQAYLRAAHGASGSAPAEVTIRIRAMAVV